MNLIDIVILISVITLILLVVYFSFFYHHHEKKGKCRGCPYQKSCHKNECNEKKR